MNKNFIIFGLVIILLSSFVFATDYLHNVNLSSNVGSFVIAGIEVNFTQSGTIHGIWKSSNSLVTACGIMSKNSSAPFNNGSFIGNYCDLNNDFTVNNTGQKYYVFAYAGTNNGFNSVGAGTIRALKNGTDYVGNSTGGVYYSGGWTITDINTYYSIVGVNMTKATTPSIFELTAKNIYDSSAIINFTATIKNATATQTITTTNGTIYWGTNELINISVSAFNFVSENFTNINTSSNYIAYLYENNSINLTIFDSKTNQIITSTNISLILDGNNTDQYLETTITNGQYYASYLKSDYYSLKAYSDPIYPPQYYFFNLENSEHQNINIYLINTTYVSTTTIQIVNQFGIIEENALISLRENINGSVVSVSERLTDSTGTALFYLKTDTNYQVYVTKNGFIPKTATISPYSATYSVTLRIDSSTVYNYSNPLTEIYFSYLPQSLFLYNKTEFQAINITTIAQNGDINWFGLYSGTTKTNVSTSPSGGTANINLNISNVLNVNVTLFIDSDLGYFEQNLTYYVGIQESNQSIEQSAKSNPINNDFVGYFATAVACLVMLFIMFELGITPEFFPIGITLILSCFYIFGMINIILPLLSGLISIGALFMRDS